MSILNCAKYLCLRRRSVPLKAPDREDVAEEEERRNILRLGTGGTAAVVAVVAVVAAVAVVAVVAVVAAVGAMGSAYPINKL